MRGRKHEGKMEGGGKKLGRSRKKLGRVKLDTSKETKTICRGHQKIFA